MQATRIILPAKSSPAAVHFLRTVHPFTSMVNLLKECITLKYLSIWLSDDLSWSKHVESVCCRARRLLGYMYQTFSPYCSQAAIIHLYKSQVIPIIEYGCVVWDPHLQKDQTLLENAQRFVVKVTTKIPRHLSLLIYIFLLSLIIEPILSCVSAVRLWNSLPRDIVLLDSLSLFKSSLKLHL